MFSCSGQNGIRNPDRVRYLFLCGEDISCNLMSSFALVDDGNCGASHLLQVLLFSIFIPIKAKFETHSLKKARALKVTYHTHG